MLSPFERALAGAVTVRRPMSAILFVERFVACPLGDQPAENEFIICPNVLAAEDDDFDDEDFDDDFDDDFEEELDEELDAEFGLDDDLGQGKELDEDDDLEDGEDGDADEEPGAADDFEDL